MNAAPVPLSWKFHTSVVEGVRLELYGLDIWEYQWTDLHLSIAVKDPIYNEEHIMGIYEISGENRTVKFAAGEFSNMVWGIYLPSIKM